jgi:V/A-type H+-transporting ATPase subunit I
MAIVKMSKISLIGLSDSKKDILRELMDLSVIDISTQEKKLEDQQWSQLVTLNSNEWESAKIAKIEGDITKVQTVLDVLRKYDTGKKPLFPTKRQVENAKFLEVISRKQELKEKIEEIYELSQQLLELRNEENRIDTIIGSLNPWEKHDLPLELEGTLYTIYMIGVMPFISDVGKLVEEIEQKNLCCAIDVINADQEQRYMSVVFEKQEEEAVMALLKQYGFNHIQFKDMVGTVSQNLSELSKRLLEIKVQRNNLEDHIRTYMGVQPEIEIIYDELLIKRDQSKIATQLLKTKQAFYLDGFIPAEMGEKAKEWLEKYDCVVTIEQPEADEECPVLLESVGFVTPFQSITNLYSTPLYKAVDPTPFFSIFYFIFFGMMLSDAGYGIVMTLGCFWLLKNYRLEGMTKKLISMLMYCGISTLFWGAMFGGWFGDAVTVVGKTFFNQDWRIGPVWFDPLQDPMKLLIFAFAIGAIHLFLGMGLKAYLLIKKGKPWDALFDIGFWVVFLVGLVLFFAGSTLSAGAVAAGKWMSILGALGLVLTQGRDKSNVFGKLISGVLSLYDVTSYLADVLSYSRLLALGLATGVIASVINTMGSLGGGGIFGAIILMVVFVGGHAFNIAINALGAFVHASRLQYVEFFGKFFEGGGKPFKPFAKSTKYTDII